MSSESLASQVEILVNGTTVDTDIMAALEELIVEQNTQTVGMFSIRIYDKEHTIINGATFKLTDEIEIKGHNGSGTGISLLKGEVTAIEPILSEGMLSEVVISGYHKSHRLFREMKSQAFLNIKDSDLASQIAGNAGLSAQTDSTTTVYDHLYQHNQSDLAFLTERAWRIGYECFVDEGKLYFRKPPTSGTTTAVKWGEDLVDFRARETLSEQVDEVNVMGWDPEKLEAIVGKSTKGTLYPSSTAGGEYKKAGSFGTGKRIIVDQPVVSQAEANVLATARINELSGAFIAVEGTAYQKPEVRAGQFVDIDGVGTRFNGKYMITSVQHIFTIQDGFLSKFQGHGIRSGLLAERLISQPPLERWYGAVIGIVTNTDDPNDWGRVKVKFPWLTDDAESWWARVMGNGAGPEAGFCIIPEVGDEVLIIFEHGDFNRPIIVGGFWNGKHTLPPPVAGAAEGEKPLIRSWHSISGHHISMYDNDDAKVELITAGGHSATFDDTNEIVEIKTTSGHTASLDDMGKKIEILSSGGHKIILDDNGRKITIQSTGDVEVKAGMNMTLSAGANMDIKASGPVNIKGAVVNIN